MLNEAFKARMQNILGEEYDEFIRALEEGEAVRGLRVNTLKCSVTDFLSKTALTLSPLPYLNEGFIPEDAISIGTSPEHHSGMIYMQDPGAMATLCALDIPEGAWVLDSCAAPGGKSTQAAARIGKTGFILSNEFVPKRAKIMLGNFERLGIRNGMITSLDTAELGKLFRGIFDLVIADVPCSGEGMFRKSEEALTEWSEENVRFCAVRQKEILENLCDLPKAGGYILYSTCTYSTEENEEIIRDFLARHGDYEICPVKENLRLHTSDGIALSDMECLKHARRFYPHRQRGEGQFIALLKRRKDTEVSPKILYKDSSKAPSRAEVEAVQKFFAENLISPPEGRIAKHADNPVLISHGCPVPPRSVFSAGVLLGEIKGSALFPSHQFFSAYGELFKRKENLKKGDPRLSQYLHGEEISAEDIKESGWCAVCYEGVPLGGGKASGGRIKNHYPKGLRNKNS